MEKRSKFGQDIDNNVTPHSSSVLIMASVRWYNASAHYALYLAEELKKDGVDVTIFGIPGSPIIEKARKSGIKVIENINLMSKNPFAYIINLIKFKKITSKSDFEIINPHISRDHTFAFLSSAARNCPLIRTRTDSSPPENNFFNKFFYSQSSSHFTVSSNFMISHLKEMGIADKKISVIPLEINYKNFTDYKPRENLREKLSIPGDRKIVSFIGRLDSVKGVEYFIRSFPFLKERENIHYIVSGEEINISKQYLEKIALDMNIKNISIIDRASDAREILSITDIGVIPSIGSEAICRIALEMLSFGIPVVGTNINSIPETISGYGGIVVKPGSAEEIGEAVNRLTASGDYLKIRTEIKQKIADISGRKFVNEYRDLFQKVTAENNKSG